MSVGKIAEKVKATVTDAKDKVKGAREATKDKPENWRIRR